MMDWFPKTPSEFMMLYTTVLATALLLFFWRKPSKGMTLRLREGRSSRHVSKGESPLAKEVEGAMPPVNVTHFSRVQPAGERPLNVMFNFNGHSWDAYEVLGLPAGSSPESVHDAFSKSILTVDASSKPFLEAAYRAIRAEWDSYKKSATG